MTDNNIIETFNLSKIYKLKGHNTPVLALNNINLSVKKGEVFGLLGPNGAGKTTMIQILTTIKTPTSGYATIDGYNILKYPNRAKQKIALMLDIKMLYYRISAYDNLKFFCKIYKVPNYEKKIYDIAKEFELEKWLKQYVESFSSGMRMKLALMRTLLLERPILFLDEPTVGIDVKTINFIIDKIKNSHTTVFLTSHDMSVVEKLCNRIAFINKGEIIKIGTKNSIANLIENEIKVEIGVIEKKNELLSELEKQDFINKIENNGELFDVVIKTRSAYKDLFSILSNYNIQTIREHYTSLEELFLKIYK